MNYAMRIIALVLLSVPLIAEEGEHGYQEQLEAAIVQSNASKVTRLLKRRTRISVKNFNHMLGWANDTIEERRMLELTSHEASVAGVSSLIGLVGGISGLCYYFDVDTIRSDVLDTFIGQEKGFFALLGLSGILATYGLFKGWSGPRSRLAKAYAILFALEDTIDAMEKKKKAHAMIAKKRSLRTKRIS